MQQGAARPCHFRPSTMLSCSLGSGESVRPRIKCSLGQKTEVAAATPGSAYNIHSDRKKRETRICDSTARRAGWVYIKQFTLTGHFLESLVPKERFSGKHDPWLPNAWLTGIFARGRGFSVLARCTERLREG